MLPSSPALKNPTSSERVGDAVLHAWQAAQAILFPTLRRLDLTLPCCDDNTLCLFVAPTITELTIWSYNDFNDHPSVRWPDALARCAAGLEILAVDCSDPGTRSAARM
jgi:hypothetical protein